jgi:hypothetical protein
MDEAPAGPQGWEYYPNLPADPTLRTPAAVGCSSRSLEHSLLTVTW